MHLVDELKKYSKRFISKDETDDYCDIPSSGIIISDNLRLKDSTDNVYRYLLNGFLIFASTYGSLTCFTSAFSIDCYYGILFFVLLVIGMLYAFMHISKRIRQIGYVVVFLSYIYMVLKLRVVIKSGFSRMVNITFEYMEEAFVLPIIKRYSEYVEDGTMAVTICLIVIGFVMSLLLNIIISEFMSFSGVLMVTFPVAQLGMYFDLMPDFFSYFLFILSPVVVLCIKMSGKYCISDNEAEYRYTIKRDKSYFKYKCDPRVSVQVAGFFASIIVVAMIVISPFVINSNYGTNSNVKKIKKSTNVYARNFAIAGFAGLFDINDGVGGISGGGELGNVNVMRMDYKTDLEVTFVPINQERFFLKAYTGSSYGDNKWRTLSDRYGSNVEISKEIDELWDISTVDMVNITSSFLKWDYTYYNDGSIYKSKLKIKNIDASLLYTYSPYYTSYDENENNIFADDTILNMSDEKEYEYYFDTNDIHDYSGMDYKKSVENIALEYETEGKDIQLNSNDSVDMLLYDYLARKIYTEVNEENVQVIEDFCEKYNLNKDDEDIVDKVMSIFEKDYTYSLKCGRTPRGDDFVNYFLIGNKEGYCAHFASAATLIYRYLGIPARYVEGYVVDYWDYDSSDVLDEDVAEYIEGDNIEELEVVKAEVNDSKAHAWVEVYQPGFGWVPVDVTPASDDEDRMGFNTGGFFNSLLELFAGNDEEIVSDEDSNRIYNTFERVRTNKSVILFSVIGIFAFVMMAISLRNILIRRNRENNINSKKINHNIIMLLDYYCKILEFVHVARKSGNTFEEYINNEKMYKYVSKDEMIKFITLAEKAQFSNNELSKEDYKFALELVMNTRKNVLEELNLFRKIVFLLYKVL